jgi:hypothetical protein
MTSKLNKQYTIGKVILKGQKFAFKSSLIEVWVWELWTHKILRFIIWQNQKNWDFHFRILRIFVISI